MQEDFPPIPDMHRWDFLIVKKYGGLHFKLVMTVDVTKCSTSLMKVLPETKLVTFVRGKKNRSYRQNFGPIRWRSRRIPRIFDVFRYGTAALLIGRYLWEKIVSFVTGVELDKLIIPSKFTVCGSLIKAMSFWKFLPFQCSWIVIFWLVILTVDGSLLWILWAPRIILTLIILKDWNGLMKNM